MRRPLTVVLDITERCNLKCTMCYFSAVDRLRFEPFDRELGRNGDMPVEIFESIARQFFPRASRVSLGCAAEPLIHPQFDKLLEVAGRYRVPDLWFPTNLLPLTEAKAEAIVRARVATVAVSIDGFTQESYERIRVGGRWSLLLERLELLREVKRRLGSRRPALRFIFTWMQSNREQLQNLPAFAAEQGASEIDVRYVCETAGVDNSTELLADENAAKLNAELAHVAHELVGRGIRLSSYPEFEQPGQRPSSLIARLRRRLWQMRAGLDRLEYRRHKTREKRYGCAYPGHTYVVRPNGTVFPCQYWSDEPIGTVPEETFASIEDGERLRRIREGLVESQPIGTCRTCSVRRDAFYRPFNESPELVPLRKASSFPSSPRD